MKIKHKISEPNQKYSNSFKKYISAFLISAIIFILGFFMSNYLNNHRFMEINKARNELQIQILDMETQLTHFKNMLCADIGTDILTHELHVIGEKLEFMSEALGSDHVEVMHLQKYYALLQIRHYQLSKQLNQRCNLGLSHILYFHSDNKQCPDCEKQAIVLTHLRRTYPSLRIYSFDYNLDLLALNIIKPIIPEEYLVPSNRRGARGSIVEKEYLPALIINNEPYFGFKTIDEIRELIN